MSTLLIIIVAYSILSFSEMAFKEARRMYGELFEELIDALPKKNKNRWSDYFYLFLIFFTVILLAVLTFIISPFGLIMRVYNFFKHMNKKNEDKNNRKQKDDLPCYKPSSEGASIQIKPQFILFGPNLPFTPDKRQIIYIEDVYHELLNGFLIEEFEPINNYLTKRNFSLEYLPYINKRVSTNHCVQYFFPHTQLQTEQISTTEFTSQNLFNFLSGRDSLPPGFLRYRGMEGELYKFSYFEIDAKTKEDVIKQFDSYLYNVRDTGGQYFSLGTPEPEDVADFSFPYEAIKIVDEIKAKVEALRVLGISEMAIKTIFNIEQRLSKMVITKDYRILLPDYNHLEIFLTPLPKAVFILFLRHPEGILFKNLSDYKEELKNIYFTISPKTNIEDLNKSIEDVTDPSKNSINEKCSRIREAFLKEFDESLSQNYFITGEKADYKKIKLDRALVIFETNDWFASLAGIE
ncbi:MAG: hypothetical protein LBC84_06200 [Prevotellaceae bacterium]|jgi:hypothetical protein|nr:hypothetical protein [Prevotellaceae bacterium]